MSNLVFNKDPSTYLPSTKRHPSPRPFRLSPSLPLTRRTAASYLSGKIVWVTGASSGLGEQLAITAARSGAAGVILSGRRHDALERVRQACEAARPAEGGGEERRVGVARVLAFDMGELDGLEEKARKAVSEFGRVDVLALNAGVSDIQYHDPLYSGDVGHFVRFLSCCCRC